MHFCPEEPIMSRAMKVSSLFVLSSILIARVGRAEHQGGIQGASYWDEQFPYFCTQGGEGMCRYWSDENSPTGSYVTGCGGLYNFHTHYYVLVYCGELP